MRLLNTTTLGLESFLGDEVPPYAILSHTWGSEEVTFQDMSHRRQTQLKGWAKIASWIDTCCIDKSDPTELGEAINSMFRWYQNDQVCYAYLADVPAQAEFKSPMFTVAECPFSFHFRSSKWFTRGWTLQA